MRSPACPTGSSSPATPTSRTIAWPDEQSVRAALIKPVEPIVVTEIFEEMARAQDA